MNIFYKIGLVGFKKDSKLDYFYMARVLSTFIKCFISILKLKQKNIKRIKRLLDNKIT
jgi:hypothetical protein